MINPIWPSDAWTNVGLSSRVLFCGIHMRSISQEMLKTFILDMSSEITIQYYGDTSHRPISWLDLRPMLTHDCYENGTTGQEFIIDIWALSQCKDRLPTYMNSHYKDKTVSWSSYLCNGYPYTCSGKTTYSCWNTFVSYLVPQVDARDDEPGWRRRGNVHRLDGILRGNVDFMRTHHVAHVFHRVGDRPVSPGKLTHLSREKWTPFRRRHFQMHLYEWKVLYYDLNFTEVCS